MSSNCKQSPVTRLGVTAGATAAGCGRDGEAGFGASGFRDWSFARTIGSSPGVHLEKHGERVKKPLLDAMSSVGLAVNPQRYASGTDSPTHG